MLVVHAAERERFEREHSLSVARARAAQLLREKIHGSEKDQDQASDTQDLRNPSRRNRQREIFEEALDELLKEKPAIEPFALPEGSKKDLYELCRQRDANLFQSFNTFARSFWQSQWRKALCAIEGYKQEG